MAEHGGRGKRVIAIDEVEVAMANAARNDAHQHFAILWFVDVDVFDEQRLLGTMEYGGLHRRSPPECLATIPRRTRGHSPRKVVSIGGLPPMPCSMCCKLLLRILPVLISDRPCGRRRCQANTR